MKAYRAAILRFDPLRNPDHAAVYEEDGLLVVGQSGQGNAGTAGVHTVHTVQAVGPYRELIGQFPGITVEHLPGRIIAPGFVDLHTHYPQVDVIGSPAPGLLPWLENYTFPEEKRFSALEYSSQVASFFIAELLRNGVTTALSFSTSHPESVNALFTQAQAIGMRMITGKCLQDRNSPEGVRDHTEQSLIDTEALIQRWHGKGRLGYAITPRFAPSCTEAQLCGAGELAAKYPDVWVQSHVAENKDEIAWARGLFPNARSYLATYADFGLMRERAIYAHCIHFDDDDRALMRERGAAAAVCPTSNLFLGSGFFDYEGADRVGFRYGLASDVGGGTSFSPFHTLLAAYCVGRTSVEGLQAKPGLSLSPQHLWWQHTAGAAQALGLDGRNGGNGGSGTAARPAIGNLQPGCEADFIVLNPAATPLLARKTARASNLDELLFAMIVLGDDRLVERTVIAGED